MKPGDRIGSYRVEGQLGAGGMGEVWQATDSGLGRQVALKLLPEDFAGEPGRHARFEREARLLASLNHPNIATLYGLEHIGGHHVLVMELVEGAGLDRIIARGPMEEDQAIRIAVQIAEALAAAHEHGIVHRDLKPANVMVRADGAVKVLDFGLAKAWEADEAAADPSLSPTLTRHVTVEGVILGTAAYMAPEQARGRPVDKRADIWAFGVVLWEMLTGRSLFMGDTLSDTLASVLKTDIDLSLLPSSTRPAVRRLLSRCLEREVADRLHDIADARIVLNDVLAGSWREAPESAPASAGAPRWWSRIVWIAIGAALATAGVVALGWQAATGPDDILRPFSLRRVTELPGAELQPSLSPDGRMIVYASAAAGNLDLYLLRVGGDRAIPLTTDPADDSRPTFSWDGDLIAFRSERDGGGLFVMGATGESVRRVTDDGFDPAFSPDGHHLAYTTEPVVDPTSREAVSELWVVEVRSGRRTRVAAGDAVQPAWSPKGDRIAYWANTNGQRDLWTVAAGGGDPVAVTQDVATDWSPEWSPDGRWLYFSSDRGGSFDIWRVRIDAGTGAADGEPEPVTTGVRGLGYARFSRDGSRLSLMAYERSFEQTIYEVDPQDVAELRKVRTLRNPSARWCALSPDGSRLACNSATSPEDLLILTSDGLEMRRLTSDLAKDRICAWRPDGHRLLFGSTRSGRWELWSIGADGSDLRQMTDIGDAVFGTWSADGTKVLVGKWGVREARTLIWLDPNRLETIETAEVVPERVGVQNFVPVSWSHGGDRLAGGLGSDSGAQVGIAIWNRATGAVERIDIATAGRSFGDVAGWSRDDRALIVRTAEGVVAVDLASGRQTVIAPTTPDAYLSLSRDGGTLSVESEVLDSDIWLMEFR